MTAASILERLRGHERGMVSLLEQLVALESPSTEPQHQDPIREVVAGQLRATGYRTRRVRASGVGDHLLARPNGGPHGRPVQLLLGHVDTVWPLGTADPHADAAAGGVVSGPGSFDMKGGLVQLVFALRCLAELDLVPQAEPVVFINTDEEIGSPDSKKWVNALSRCACRAFVLEPAYGPEGALKVGRKGVGRYAVRAKGLAAHAGLDPTGGASAVLEIAHQIQRLFELNDPQHGVTVNVGTVDGGLRPNVVAPEAVAQVDVRVFRSADAARVDAAIRSLAPIDGDVSLEVEGGFGRPPMEPDDAAWALWDHARRAADDLGITIDHAVVGGASDGNLTSQHTPTLDGLGAVGDGAHRADEHVRSAHMPERAALLAMLLMAPVAGDDG